MNMAENEEIKALEEKTEKTEETEQVIEKKPEEAAVSKASKDDLSAMNDRELLIALLKEQKKASRRSLITATALVAICLMIGAALLIIVPRINATLNNAYQAIDNIETVVANADKAIGSVEKSLTGIDQMVKNVDKVVVDNTDSVSKTVDRMSSIDIASLNKSIKDLSDIIEPLAKFFRR
jgi:predicted PurR-regulated permease PerM